MKQIIKHNKNQGENKMTKEIDYKNLNKLMSTAAKIDEDRVNILIDLHWKELITIQNVVDSLQDIIKTNTK